MYGVKITTEGGDISDTKVKEAIMDCSASIHSIDGVSAGIKIVEEANIPQDR